jgi:hypothetical protein
MPEVAGKSFVGSSHTTAVCAQDVWREPSEHAHLCPAKRNTQLGTQACSYGVRDLKPWEHPENMPKLVYGMLLWGKGLCSLQQAK